MPKKQAVYGKRPKATCNSANIFASPDNTKRKAVETVNILSDDEIERRKSKAVAAQSIESPVRNRRPLGEINGNAVLHVEVPKEKTSTKSKQSKTKKQVKNDAAAEKTVLRSEPLDKGVVPQAIDLTLQSTELPDAVELEAQTQIFVPVEEQIEATEAMAQETEAPAGTSSKDSPTGDPYTQHCASLLELTSHPVSSFSAWADDMREDFSLVKIAEASFGEVYRLSLHPETAQDSDLPLSRNDESVLKVIALTQPTETLPKSKRDRERALNKAENMSKPADVASELKLLQRLSDIPGFTNFRDLRVLRGRPPGPFAEAFQAFNASQKAAKKEPSIFPDPAKKASYSKDQLWAVIEMQDAGTDLEKLVAQGVSSSIWVVWDIFWQVVLALAKGEEEAEFEHRDLHLGNICVRTPLGGFDEATVDVSKSLGFTSFEATLIDYTVSRASMVPACAHGDGGGGKDNSEDDQVAYINLANDPHLFYGDSAEEYQYDIYRYMRGSIYYSSPYARFPNDGSEEDPTSNANENTDEDHNEEPEEEQQEEEEQEPPLATPPTPAQMAEIAAQTRRSWRQFHPQTNLVWLHYILYMLLENMSWPAKKAPSKKTKPAEHARWKHAKELEAALLKVQEELDPGWLGEEGSLGRSGEVVAWAVEEGWLGVGDVVGATGGGEFEVFGEEDLVDLVVGEEEDVLVKGLEGLALDGEAAKKSKKGGRKASKKKA